MTGTGPRRPRSAQAPAQRRRSTDPARTAAFAVLREVAENDAYANLVLPPLLRQRQVAGRDAAFATELTYGTLRLRGRYDAILALTTDRPLAELDPPVLDILRLGAHQLLGMRVPAHAAVSETVALARHQVGVGPSHLVNAVLRRVSQTPLNEWLRLVGEGQEPVDALAATESHPAWIVRSFKEALVAHGRSAEELPTLLNADNVAPEVSLVARPGLVDVGTLAASTGTAAAPRRLSPLAVQLTGGDPRSIGAVRSGRAGVQDEGSQLVALALAAAEVRPTDTSATAAGTEVPPERWLDMCAGPGGKAALLGALAAERGATLVANEALPHRADLVRTAVAALPAGTVEVRTGDGRGLGELEPASFDRVLVDAPCTGLGALRRRPESRWRRTPADLAPLTTLQRELLTSALDAVRPGGVVGYVTCSPHQAETLLVVKDVLRRRADVEVLDARTAMAAVLHHEDGEERDDVDLGPGPAVQLWPHVHGTDAMHLTLLRRT